MLSVLVLQGAVVPGLQAQSPDVEPTVVASAEQTMDQAVDINTASAEELAAGLTGIGLAKAEAIIRYREQFGPFESIDELGEVKGIGAATLDKNRALIRVQ